MGTNFHTAWANTVTAFTAASMTPALSALDLAITYMKNVIVACEGDIGYNKATGALTWSDTLHIYFTDEAGLTKHNSVAAGSVTLADGQFAYVDLSETNDTALTVAAAAISEESASNTISYARLVLAYRDTESNNIYPVYLRPRLNDPDKLVQVLTCADSVTVDWSAGSTAEITLDRATTTFTFAGGYHGQRCVLIIQQYADIGAVAFGSEVRACADLSSPPTLSGTTDLKDYLGYIYNGTDAVYDFVSLVKGF